MNDETNFAKFSIFFTGLLSSYQDVIIAASIKGRLFYQHRFICNVCMANILVWLF
jgi:hypothetical protein